MTTTLELDGLFAALADPTRRDIVLRLGAGPATVSEIAAPYAMSLQAVSLHLKVLERSGLVERGREGKTRPCRLAPAALEVAAGWIEQSRKTWSDRVDRLEAHLAAHP